ncbi:VanZ family protein [Mesobacillus thioparans]
MHFIAFTGVSISIGVLILIFTGPQDVKGHLKVVWFTLVTIGIIEEYRQYWDPGRSAEFLDAMANIAGVSIGVGIILGISFLIINKQRVLSNIFRVYPILLMMLLLGLLYINERPFLRMDVSVQERIRGLAALIGF